MFTREQFLMFSLDDTILLLKDCWDSDSGLNWIGSGVATLIVLFFASLTLVADFICLPFVLIGMGLIHLLTFKPSEYFKK